MINLLGELRAGAARGLPRVESDFTVEKAPDKTGKLAHLGQGDDYKLSPQVKDNAADLEEFLEFLDQMDELYTEILGHEGGARQALVELHHHVSTMEETIQMEKEALLPTTIMQLYNRFEGQELVCQRMIHRAKSMLDTLRDNKAEVVVEIKPGNEPGFCGRCARWFCCCGRAHNERLVQKVPAFLDPVRQSIASARAAEYKRLVLRFFAARSANKADLIVRTTRQLTFAFPDAMEHEVEQVMEFPEHAMSALAQRLEKGQDGITLEHVIMAKEADSEKENLKRLVVGSKELQLLMMQFAELVGSQGDALDDIEANIKSVLEVSNEAIETLTEALAQKKKYEENMRRLHRAGYVLCCCIAFVIVSFLIRFCEQNHEYIAPAVNALAAPVASLKSKAAQVVAPSSSELQLNDIQSKLGNKHQFQVREKYRSAAQHSRRVAQPGGFMAQYAAWPVNSSVIHSLALTSRGKAARHSALRKRSAAIQQDDVKLELRHRHQNTATEAKVESRRSPRAGFMD